MKHNTLRSEFIKPASPPDLCALLNFINSGTALARADMAMIFGNKYICRELAQSAAEIYHNNLASRILISGGVISEDGTREADAIARHLTTRLDVPEHCILMETQSTNTGENVTLSLKLLEDMDMADDIASIITIGHFAAGPRFRMTLKRHAPHINTMHLPTYPEGMDEDNWHQNRVMLGKVSNEYHKITPYIEAGFIAPLNRAPHATAPWAEQHI